MVTSKPVSQQLFQKLLVRTGLQDKAIVHFSDFFSKFRIVPSSAYPQWMTSISKNFNDRPILNASQVHALLKEKARQRSVTYSMYSTPKRSCSYIMLQLDINAYFSFIDNGR